MPKAPFRYHEAAERQYDVWTGREPFPWIVNQSLSTLAVSDRLLPGRKAGEIRHLVDLARDYASRMAIVPRYCDPPVGIRGLEDFAAAESVSANSAECAVVPRLQRQMGGLPASFS